MNSGNWSLVSYREGSARSAVRALRESLDETDQESSLVAVEMLRVRNVQAREPLVRHLEGKLWELRRESRTNIYRVIYFFFVARRIVLLHGFQKKTQKTPRQEIETALARYNRFIQREGGDKQ